MADIPNVKIMAGNLLASDSVPTLDIFQTIRGGLPPSHDGELLDTQDSLLDPASATSAMGLGINIFLPETQELLRRDGFKKTDSKLLSDSMILDTQNGTMTSQLGQQPGGISNSILRDTHLSSINTALHTMNRFYQASKYLSNNDNDFSDTQVNIFTSITYPDPQVKSLRNKDSDVIETQFQPAIRTVLSEEEEISYIEPSLSPPPKEHRNSSGSETQQTSTAHEHNRRETSLLDTKVSFASPAANLAACIFIPTYSSLSSTAKLVVEDTFSHRKSFSLTEAKNLPATQELSSTLPVNNTLTATFTPQASLSNPIQGKLPKNKISCIERKRLIASPTRPSNVTQAMIEWVDKTNGLLDPFREDDDCWLHPFPPTARVGLGGIPRPVGKLQKAFTWRDIEGRHSIVLNFGIVVKLISYKMTKQQQDGFISKQWHLSHLCGNWTCLNPDHTTVEPGYVNCSRNNCFMHRSGCLHTPKCMKEKKVALGPDGKLIDHSQSRSSGPVGKPDELPINDDGPMVWDNFDESESMIRDSDNGNESEIVDAQLNE